MPLVSSFGVLEAHRLEIIPARGVIRHGYAVLIAQDDAGAVEHAPDRRVKLARDFGLRSPHRAQHGGDIEGRDLVDRSIE